MSVSARAEFDRLRQVEAAARRLAEAVPYYHELTDYVEYEVAYAELCHLLSMEPESLRS